MNDQPSLENVLTWELMFSVHTDGYGRVAVVSAPGDEFTMVDIGPNDGDEDFAKKVQAAMLRLMGN